MKFNSLVHFNFKIQIERKTQKCTTAPADNSTSWTDQKQPDNIT